MIAAFLFAQLEEAEKIIASRSETFHHYYKGLKDLEYKGLIRLPHLEDGSTGNGHLFYILARSEKECKSLMKHLASENIQGIPHYVPLHSSKAGLKFAQVSGSMKVMERVSQRLIRLPLYYGMEEEEVERIVKVIYNFYAG